MGDRAYHDITGRYTKWAHVLVTGKTLGMRGFKRSVIDRWKCHALPPGTCLRVRSYGFQMRHREHNTCPCYLLISRASVRCSFSRCCWLLLHNKSQRNVVSILAFTLPNFPHFQHLHQVSSHSKPLLN
jgi:hypothetical protein